MWFAFFQNWAVTMHSTASTIIASRQGHSTTSFLNRKIAAISQAMARIHSTIAMVRFFLASALRWLSVLAWSRISVMTRSSLALDFSAIGTSFYSLGPAATISAEAVVYFLKFSIKLFAKVFTFSS